MVGILLSYWGGLFSGATLVSGRVPDFCIFSVPKKSHLWSEISKISRAKKTLLILRCRSGLDINFARLEMDPQWIPVVQLKKIIRIRCIFVQSPWTNLYFNGDKPPPKKNIIFLASLAVAVAEKEELQQSQNRPQKTTGRDDTFGGCCRTDSQGKGWLAVSPTHQLRRLSKLVDDYWSQVDD